MLGLSVGAALWEYFGSQVIPAFGAPLSATVVRFFVLLSSGELATAFASSMKLFFTGFPAAVLAASLTGLLMSRVRYLRIGIENYVMLLYVTPMVALLPFISSILGVHFATKFVVVFLFGFFPVLYNTLEGGRSLKPEFVDVARSFRSGELALWRDLLIPYSLPYILTGVRQGSGRALVGVVASEFLVSGSGLGGLIQWEGGKYIQSGVLATIAVLTAMGLLLMWAGRLLEEHFAAWRGLNR